MAVIQQLLLFVKGNLMDTKHIVDFRVDKQVLVNIVLEDILELAVVDTTVDTSITAVGTILVDTDLEGIVMEDIIRVDTDILGDIVMVDTDLVDTVLEATSTATCLLYTSDAADE